MALARTYRFMAAALARGDRLLILTLWLLAILVMVGTALVATREARPPLRFVTSEVQLGDYCPGDTLVYESDLIALVEDDLLSFRSIRRVNQDAVGSRTVALIDQRFFSVEAGDRIRAQAIAPIPREPLPGRSYETGEHYLLVSVSHVGLSGAPARQRVRFTIPATCTGLNAGALSRHE